MSRRKEDKSLYDHDSSGTGQPGFPGIMLIAVIVGVVAILYFLVRLSK